MLRVSVIYGTGMSDISNLFSVSLKSPIVSIRCESNWGTVPLSIIKKNNLQISFLNRHHSINNHITPPHSIKHRGNIHAVASFSPDIIISINSVGSISSELKPGEIGLASDIIDFTEYAWSFHDIIAHHSDRTSNFDTKAIEIISEVLKQIQGSEATRLIVAQCNGPQFESPAEINALEILGAEAVNMTLGPESRLISELSIPHVSILCSSNWAAGKNPKGSKIVIDHKEVENTSGSMKKIVLECINYLITNYQV